jgi:hypothetical protein
VQREGPGSRSTRSFVGRWLARTGRCDSLARRAGLLPILRRLKNDRRQEERFQAVVPTDVAGLADPRDRTTGRFGVGQFIDEIPGDPLAGDELGPSPLRRVGLEARALLDAIERLGALATADRTRRPIGPSPINPSSFEPFLLRPVAIESVAIESVSVRPIPIHPIPVRAAPPVAGSVTPPRRQTISIS